MPEAAGGGGRGGHGPGGQSPHGGEEVCRRWNRSGCLRVYASPVQRMNVDAPRHSSAHLPSSRAVFGCPRLRPCATMLPFSADVSVPGVVSETWPPTRDCLTAVLQTRAMLKIGADPRLGGPSLETQRSLDTSLRTAIAGGETLSLTARSARCQPLGTVSAAHTSIEQLPAASVQRGNNGRDAAHRTKHHHAFRTCSDERTHPTSRAVALLGHLPAGVTGGAAISVPGTDNAPSFIIVLPWLASRDAQTLRELRGALGRPQQPFSD